jgi:hypothetical protein
VPFAFADPVVTVKAFGNAPPAAATAKVAEEVRASLSSLYDRGFVDPKTWSDGLPPDIWSGFAQAAAGRAEGDASSLTLGRQPGLEQLEVTRSKLRVSVLYDAQRRAQAAIATVAFRAIGDMEDGSLLDLRSDATFLFRPVSGRWVITGFPASRVTADSDVAPSPTPTASASASAGATP